MNPSETCAEFVTEFCSSTRLRPAGAQDISEAEREIGTPFPSAYRAFLTRHGSGATPDLPALAREAQVWPMTQILSPPEAVTASRAAWQAGMPRHLVAIARGEDDDLLCFQRAQSGKRSVEEALWTFLPDSGQAVRAFGSFDECLREYLEARYDRDE